VLQLLEHLGLLYESLTFAFVKFAILEVQEFINEIKVL